MRLSQLHFRWLIAIVALVALVLTLALNLPGEVAPGVQPVAVAGTPSAAPSPTLPPTPTRTPRPTATPAPVLRAGATTSALTITFHLDGQVPAGADEALLWYDTSAGRAIRRIPLESGQTLNASLTITPTQEGLTITEELAGQAPSTLDYWWAVRDRSGTLIRRAGALALPPTLATLAQTEPVTAPAELDWVERATPHFRLRVPPDTAAERDIDRLAEIAEASYTQATQVISPTEPVSTTVYLVPRVFWQGGVAYGEGGPLVISYLDRNYIGVEMWSYFVHEVTHALGSAVVPREGEVGGVLGEGVAVYAAGGHYALEPIDAWAAALAASDRYIPLCELRYDFYSAQHEIAYQEGASFVAYLIRTYGLETFTRIYAAQRPQRGERETNVTEFCATDNQRAVPPTGKTNGELEQAWLDYLKTIMPAEQERRSWELTIRFFDTMRRYQETLDPPARNLPPPPEEWDRATAANFLNAARGRRAAALETMLGAAGRAITGGEVDYGTTLLDTIEASLEQSGALSTSLARDYDAITGLLDTQARALRLGEGVALRQTLATDALAARLPFTTGDLLHDLRYNLAELDVRGDRAEGIIGVDGASLDGRSLARALYKVRFTRGPGGWRMTEWSEHQPKLDLPPGQVGDRLTRRSGV